MKTTPEERQKWQQKQLLTDGTYSLHHFAEFAWRLLDDFVELELSRDFIRGNAEAYKEEVNQLQTKLESAREVIEYGVHKPTQPHPRYQEWVESKSELYFGQWLMRQWLNAHPKKENPS